MKPPDWERADIDARKVRDYLLSRAHPIGRYKAAFFRHLGYRQESWQRLRDDLLALAKENPAEAIEATRYGQKYLVRGILTGPEREAAIRTVWIVPTNEDMPKLVSAYPGEHR